MLKFGGKQQEKIQTPVRALAPLFTWVMLYPALVRRHDTVRVI